MFKSSVGVTEKRPKPDQTWPIVTATDGRGRTESYDGPVYGYPNLEFVKTDEKPVWASLNRSFALEI